MSSQDFWAKLHAKRLEIQAITSPRRSVLATPKNVPGSWPKSAQKNVNVTQQLQTFIDEMDQDPFMSMLQEVEQHEIMLQKQLRNFKSPKDTTIYHDVASYNATPLRPKNTRARFNRKLSSILDEETPDLGPAKQQHIQKLPAARKLSKTLMELQNFGSTPDLAQKTPLLTIKDVTIDDPMQVDTPRKSPTTATTLLPPSPHLTPLRPTKAIPLPTPLNPTQTSRIRELEAQVLELQKQLDKQEPVREVVKESGDFEYEHKLRLALVQELEDLREFSEMELSLAKQNYEKLEKEMASLRKGNARLQNNGSFTESADVLLLKKDQIIEKLESEKRELTLLNEELQQRLEAEGSQTMMQAYHDAMEMASTNIQEKQELERNLVILEEEHTQLQIKVEEMLEKHQINKSRYNEMVEIYKTKIDKLRSSVLEREEQIQQMMDCLSLISEQLLEETENVNDDQKIVLEQIIKTIEGELTVLEMGKENALQPSPWPKTPRRLNILSP